MGQAKAQWIRDEERGVDSSATGFYVCQNCFSNPGLRHFIAEHAVEQDPDDPYECDFCDHAVASPVLAEFDQVCEYLVRCVEKRYSDPVDELPFETAEGGYQGNCLDTFDVLEGDAQLDMPNDLGTLREQLERAIKCQVWCQRDYFALTEAASLRVSWAEFQKVVKTGTANEFIHGRFPEDRETRTPFEFLNWLGEQAVEFGLVRSLPAGQSFYRVRKQSGGAKHKTARDLGPPPVRLATQSNRLSPAGISMMYAAEDEDTAMGETADEAGTYAVARFSTTRDVSLLDLVSLPEPICFFDLTDADSRDAVGFLRGFADEVSLPLEKGADREKGYRPTQAVTQHFRDVRYLGKPLDGIRYRSAQKRGGVCLGLFANDSSVFDSYGPAPADAWINLVGVSERNL